MKCYEEPRKTNEETDSCAAEYRTFMNKSQEEMQKGLMAKCVRKSSIKSQFRKL